MRLFKKAPPDPFTRDHAEMAVAYITAQLEQMASNREYRFFYQGQDVIVYVDTVEIDRIHMKFTNGLEVDGP